MTTEIRFEDPPPESRGKRGVSKRNRDISEKLRKRQGEWAWVHTSATRGAAASLAHHIKVGTSPSFRPAGSFEAISRVVNEQCRVYARYIGPHGEHR
jgi:hypothetical protein